METPPQEPEVRDPGPPYAPEEVPLGESLQEPGEHPEEPADPPEPGPEPAPVEEAGA